MSKYRNCKTIVDGITFDSKAEARRYGELKLLLKAGAITDLIPQAPFELVPSVVLGNRKRPAIKYKADFVYTENGHKVVEDVKGMKTAVYSLKKHLMKHVHGIEIREITQ